MSASVRADTFWQRAVLHAVIFIFAALPLGLAAYALIDYARGAEGFVVVLDLIAFLPSPALMCMPGMLLYTAALDAFSRRASVGVGVCLLFTPLVVLPWLAIAGLGLVGWSVFAIGIGTALFAFGVLAFLARRAGWFGSYSKQAAGAQTA